jgi:hypothetical protein
MNAIPTELHDTLNLGDSLAPIPAGLGGVVRPVLLHPHTAYLTEPPQPSYDALHDLAARADLSVEERHDHLTGLLWYIEQLMDRLLEGTPV